CALLLLLLLTPAPLLGLGDHAALMICGHVLQRADVAAQLIQPTWAGQPIADHPVVLGCWLDHVGTTRPHLALALPVHHHTSDGSPRSRAGSSVPRRQLQSRWDGRKFPGSKIRSGRSLIGMA